MLKVTPCSKEEVGCFNFKLVTEEYPADIHCHEISAAHIHIVVKVGGVTLLPHGEGNQSTMRVM